MKGLGGRGQGKPGRGKGKGKGKGSVPSGSNPYDFGSMRVIHNLHAEPPFNVSAGWRQELEKVGGFQDYQAQEKRPTCAAGRGV